MIDVFKLVGHITLLLLMAFSAFTCLATRNKPDCNDTIMLRAGQNLKVGGWSMMTVFYLYYFLESGEIPIPAPLNISIGILALAGSVIRVASLLDPEEDWPYEGCSQRY